MLAALCVACLSSANAADSTWFGGFSTDWGDTNNWDNGLPTTGAIFGAADSNPSVDLGESGRNCGGSGDRGITFNAAVNTTIGSLQTNRLTSEYIIVNGGSHKISAQMLGSPNTRIMGHGDLTLSNVNTFTFCIGSNEGRAPAGMADKYAGGTVTLLGNISSGGCVIGDIHYGGQSPVTVAIGGNIRNTYWFTGLLPGIRVTVLEGSHTITDTYDGVYISSITFDGPGDLEFGANTWLDERTNGETTYTMNGNGSVIFDGLKEYSAPWKLVKAGPGVMEIRGSATYTGSTTINAGTLKLGVNGSLASADIAVEAGAVLDVTATESYVMAAANTYTFGVTPAGDGSAGRIDAGALNISSAHVVMNATGTLDDPVYILATYTPPLTGEHFASVAALPRRYMIDYSYHENQIALVRIPATGTVLTVQ